LDKKRVFNDPNTNSSSDFEISRINALLNLKHKAICSDLQAIAIAAEKNEFVDQKSIEKFKGMILSVRETLSRR
jgi:hypothetical protein